MKYLYLYIIIITYLLKSNYFYIKGGLSCKNNDIQIIKNKLKKLREIVFPSKNLSNIITDFNNLILNTLLNLNKENINFDNINNKASIYYWINQTKIVPNNSRELYDIINNLKTIITDKYNKLLIDVNLIIGGYNKKLAVGLCNILNNNILLDKLKKNITNNNKKIYLPKIKNIYNNFTSNINKIIDTTNKSVKIQTNTKLIELLSNSIYYKDFTVDILKTLYKNNQSQFINKSLPNNFIYTFYLEYNRNITISNRNILQRNYQMTNIGISSDYKLNNTFYNFYLKTGNLYSNTKYNAALYKDSLNEYYILYNPLLTQISNFSRLIFDSRQIPHKKYIKLNNVIFEIKNIIYNPTQLTQPIRFNIKNTNIKLDIFNIDILKTKQYILQNITNTPKLNSISIYSNNKDRQKAFKTDNIILTFESNQDLPELNVRINNTNIIPQKNNNIYTAEFNLNNDRLIGVSTFIIDYSNGFSKMKSVTSTTDNTKVLMNLNDNNFMYYLFINHKSSYTEQPGMVGYVYIKTTDQDFKDKDRKDVFNNNLIANACFTYPGSQDSNKDLGTFGLYENWSLAVNGYYIMKKTTEKLKILKHQNGYSILNPKTNEPITFRISIKQPNSSNHMDYTSKDARFNIYKVENRWAIKLISDPKLKSWIINRNIYLSIRYPRNWNYPRNWYSYPYIYYESNVGYVTLTEKRKCAHKWEYNKYTTITYDKYGKNNYFRQLWKFDFY